jgi:hypothetical protein
MRIQLTAAVRLASNISLPIPPGDELPGADSRQPRDRSI